MKDEKGALVSHVNPGSPAEKAGIKRGDVIVSFDGKEISEMKDLPYIVGSTPVDKKVRVVVIRNGKEKQFKIKVGELEEAVEGREIKEPESDLGMTVEELTPQLAHNLGLSETSGVIVVKVQRDSPAAEAGIQQGDLILEIGQGELKNLSEFHGKIQSYEKLVAGRTDTMNWSLLWSLLPYLTLLSWNQIRHRVSPFPARVFPFPKMKTISSTGQHELSFPEPALNRGFP
ncbi:MAG: PDZ domain-containing protein [Deltaproteobacteria bacterium]|nr:PDZ domain-containing protein [Deltaproteobacteria bacterium]